MSWLADKLRPPGMNKGVRWEEEDEREIAIVSRGDAFDVYFGRESVYAVSISVSAAMRIGRFLMWWWVWHSWFGIRTALWRWALRSKLKRKSA